MAKFTLDHKFVEKLQPPSKYAKLYFDDHKDAPKGFALKVSVAGSKTWVLNYYVKGREKRLQLEKGFPAWGPKRARIEASNLKTRIIAGEDVLEERRKKAKAKEQARQAKMDRAHLTLGALCLAYVEQLERDGKSSAQAVDNCLRKNVELAFPKLWNTPAEDLDVDHFLDIVAALTDDGKKREAAKLRSYLRAAYTCAIAPVPMPRQREKCGSSN